MGLDCRLGALLIIGAAIALFDVAMATLVTVYYVGAAMLVAGAMEIVTAFQIRPLGRSILWAAIGALTFFAGVLAFRDHCGVVADCDYRRCFNRVRNFPAHPRIPYS